MCVYSLSVVLVVHLGACGAWDRVACDETVCMYACLSLSLSFVFCEVCLLTERRLEKDWKARGAAKKLAAEEPSSSTLLEEACRGRAVNGPSVGRCRVVGGRAVNGPQGP